MNSIIEYCVSNWEIICSIISGVLVVAAAIAKLTPSPKDDVVVEKVQEHWNKVSKKK